MLGGYGRSADACDSLIPVTVTYLVGGDASGPAAPPALLLLPASASYAMRARLAALALAQLRPVQGRQPRAEITTPSGLRISCSSLPPPAHAFIK